MQTRAVRSSTARSYSSTGISPACCGSTTNSMLPLRRYASRMSGSVGKSRALTMTWGRCRKSRALRTAPSAADTEALTPTLPGGAPTRRANFSAVRATLGIHSVSQGLPWSRQESMKRSTAASTRVHSGAWEQAATYRARSRRGNKRLRACHPGSSAAATMAGLDRVSTGPEVDWHIPCAPGRLLRYVGSRSPGYSARTVRACLVPAGAGAHHPRSAGRPRRAGRLADRRRQVAALPVGGAAANGRDHRGLTPPGAHEGPGRIPRRTRTACRLAERHPVREPAERGAGRGRRRDRRAETPVRHTRAVRERALHGESEPAPGLAFRRGRSAQHLAMGP